MKYKIGDRIKISLRHHNKIITGNAKITSSAEGGYFIVCFDEPKEIRTGEMRSEGWPIYIHEIVGFACKLNRKRREV